MSGESKIEWTGRTWNPLVGCSKVSGGCKFCYAERDSGMPRLQRVAQYGGGEYKGHSYLPVLDEHGRFNGNVNEVEHKLLEPLSWRKPCRVFVNSMSDVFHERVSDGYRDKIFAVMALAGRHQFQVLTKRADVMREYFADIDSWAGRVLDEMEAILTERGGLDTCCPTLESAPLPNVWLGTSVENQEAADLRIPDLLGTPAALRFVSCEPLLGPVRLDRIKQEGPGACGPVYSDVLNGRSCSIGGTWNSMYLDWVIVGGESGEGARAIHPDWVRSLRDQCVEARVPFFFKQWGEHDEQGQRVGKAKTGRLLDGREWNEMPYTEAAQ